MIVALLVVQEVSGRIGGSNTAAMYAAPHRHWLSTGLHGFKVSGRTVGAGVRCKV